MNRETALALLRGAATSLKAALEISLGGADVHVIQAALSLDEALAIADKRVVQTVRDAGEFTQPPNCGAVFGGVDVSEVVAKAVGPHLAARYAHSDHPMHAVALEMAEAAITNQTQPGEVGN